MNIAEEVAKIVLDIKAITFNLKVPYRFTSGIISPVYTDCRLFMSYPKERGIIRNYYVEAIKKLDKKVDLIAGTATAGIPHAAWVAEAMELPMVYVRGKAKEYGKGNQIEGLTKENQYAVVIEDHISTGKSSVETASALRNAGVSVDYIFSITTYNMKLANDKFTENKLESISLTTFTDVVAMAAKLNYIKQDEQQTVLEWAANPSGWGKQQGFE